MADSGKHEYQMMRFQRCTPAGGMLRADSPMDIFTIGFTQKSASEFFETLKAHGIEERHPKSKSRSRERLLRDIR